MRYFRLASCLLRLLTLGALFGMGAAYALSMPATDLNGDGKSDLLYRNSSTGQVYRMLMNGFAISAAGLAYTEPNTAWKIVADADFNGDAISDLLWRNDATGQVYLMPFNASGMPNGGAVIVTEPNAAWKIVHTSDLDGNGRADILWWNSTTGQVYAMVMNGSTITAQGFVYTEPNTAWKIVAVGDFAGSGKKNQLLWRNSTTGQVYLMTVTVAGGVFSQTGAMIYTEPNTAWKIIAAADFNGDGKSDILYRNDVTGQVYMLLMNGGAVAGGGLVHTEPNLAWKVVAQGDYNGDGKADLLWRNDATGQVYMMLMNGVAISSQAFVYTEANTQWRLLGPREYVTASCSANTFCVAGTLSGLGPSKSVVLQNNGGNNLTLGANGAFTFSATVANGSGYAVIVFTQPAGQICSVANGTGTSAGANVTNVAITCAANAFTIGGTVSGLTGTVVLQNNGGDNLTVPIDGAFTFPSVAVNGSPYNVTVLTQPPSQNCAVSNGTGTISGTSVGNVSVTCSIVTAESCNGRDDNGNGQIDEGLGTFSSGLGACRRTVAACTAGVLNAVLPGSPLSVITDTTPDGVDDNCNGAVDEDSPICVRVAPNGNDASALANANATPFLTIQAAINYSAANQSVPNRICVAAGAACGSVGTYSGNVVMANGVSVYGGYESTNFTRCTAPVPATVTVIQSAAAEGVRFPVSVVDPTILFNFRIDRATTLTTSGVTVDGAQNVLLASVFISNTPAVERSYGVNVINAGQATVAASRITGGTGSIETIGVRAVNSQVAVSGNCQTLDPTTGRCTAGTTNRGILGRPTPGLGESYAVLLDNSPLSIVEESSLSANSSEVGANIRIKGNGAGIRIRANNINAFDGALDSHGIWAEDCAGASPWIVNNSAIRASGTSPTSRSSAIRAIGSCHPVVEGNLVISAGLEGQTAASIGVHCGKNASQVGSQCVVVKNAQIAGGGGNVSSTGIFCEDGSCARIEGNGISNSNVAPDTYGLRLGQTGVRVEANTIFAGCGANSSTGVLATGSRARLANNFISGGFGCLFALALSRGLHVVNTGGPGEIDVHSNTITARGALVACTSVALEMDASTVSPPLAGKGIFRNNILHGGDCANRYGVRELAASADPRVFENNDIVPAGAASALYLNEGTTVLTTAAQVNALTDMSVANILALDPLFVTYPGELRLQAASPLRAAGTAAGAPAIDFFGQARNPAMPSIGADESPP